MRQPPFGLSSLAAAILASTLSLSGCGDWGLSADDHIARARSHQERGEIQAAAIEAKNALQKAPDRSEARALLGTLYLDLGDGASAEKELRRAVELGLAPQQAKLGLTRALFYQGRYDDIIKASVEEAAHPSGGETGLSGDELVGLLALRGDAYLARGRLEVAEKLYDEALKIRADAPDALVGKARLSAVRGQLDEARQRLLELTAANRNVAAAWSLLGDVERYEGDLERAEDAYGKAIDGRFNNVADRASRALIRAFSKKYDAALADVHALREKGASPLLTSYLEGVIQFRQEKYADAQRLFQEVLKERPDDSVANFYLGATQYFVGRYEQAADHLRRFLSAAPGNELGSKVLAASLLRMGDATGAEAALRPALARNPKDPDALGLLAEASMRQGRVKEGTAQLRELVSLRPDSAQAYLRLGVGLVRTGARDEGVAMLGQAATRDPAFARARLFGIATLLQAGDFRKALEEARQLEAAAPDDPDVLVLVAASHLGLGQEGEARLALEKALTAVPGHPEAADQLAKLDLRRGDAAGARQRYEAVLLQNPNHLGTLMRMAGVELAQGRVAESRGWVERAMRAHPEAIQPRAALATAYLEQGDPDQALALIQAVEAKQPDVPEFLRVKGSAYIEKREFAQAQQVLEQLVKVDPGSAQAHYLLAKAQAGLGDGREASLSLDRALERNPRHLLANAARARDFADTNRPADAMRILQQLERDYPNNPSVLSLKAWLALRGGRPAEAALSYRQLLQRAPSTELVLDLAQSEWLAGQVDSSLKTLKDWLAARPQDVAAQFFLANSYLTLGKEDEARLAFARLVELSPRDALAHNNLAWLLRRSDPAKAKKHAERALELEPRSPFVMDTLGVVLLEQGDTERALRLLQAAYEGQPNDPNIGVHLARALVRSGDRGRARSTLSSVLELNPSFDSRAEAETLLRELSSPP